MNYYGINRKVPTVNKTWIGPRARLEQKAKEESAREWLDEVVKHVVKIDPLEYRTEEVVASMYNRWVSLGFECSMKRTPFDMEVTVKGKRGDLMKEFKLQESLQPSQPRRRTDGSAPVW